MPERLAELIALWWSEADRHGVLPLDDRGIELFGVRFRDKSPHPESKRYVYRPPMSPMPGQATAPIAGRSFDLIARIDRAADDEGVLFATGTENSGLAVFVQNNRLVLDYNAFDNHSVIESDVEVPVGESVLTVRLRRGSGRSGSAELDIDGVTAGHVDLALFMRMISSVGASVGYNHGSAVSTRYAAPFAFTGHLHEVVIELVGRPSAEATAAAARAEMSRQ